jgi:hypothetical protein
MTVLGAYAPVREAGNGSKVDFDFSFKAISSSDLKVGKILNSTDVKTDMALGVDYTVALNAITDGGTVTYMVAPTALQDSWIGRDAPITQEQDIPTNNNLRETQIENALDKATMIDQQLQEQIDRCVKVADTSTLTELTLPDPEDGLALVWDGTSGALQNAPVDAGAIADGITAAEAAQTAAEAAQTAAEAAAAAIATLASQAEAEAGADNTKFMSPLRTAQAIDAQTPAQVGLGSWAAKNKTTVYQAATDGIVTAFGTAAGPSYDTLTIYTDAANPPTVERVSTQQQYTWWFALTAPVKKNDYYSIGSGGTITAFFIPLGS